MHGSAASNRLEAASIIDVHSTVTEKPGCWVPQRAAPSCFFCKPFLFPASLPARLPAHDYLRPRKLFQQSSVFHCFFFALSQVLKPNPICNPSPLWASTPRTKLVFLAKFDRSLIFHDALGKKSISVIFLPTEPSLDALVLSPPSPPGWWVGRTPLGS